MATQLLGRVVGCDGRYFAIECPEAPAHLRVLHLVAGQMAGATIGDRVRLAYHATASRGLWNVVERVEQTA